MTVSVLVAVTDSGVEQRLVAAFGRPGAVVSVARRCVDLADLLAAAESGVARAALFTGDLRNLDADAVSRLRAAGVGVVALAADEQDERALRGMGMGAVLPISVDADAVSVALVDAARSIAEPPTPDGDALAELAGSLGPADLAQLDPASAEADIARGEVIAVWGPPGAPGRTFVATALASELAMLGAPTLLVDADVYASSVAQTLGLVDEVPGLAAAAREANLGVLDAAKLAGHARAVDLDRTRTSAALSGTFQVLTGLPRADRWPELRPDAVVRVLELARVLYAVTVVDCSSCLESDEELSYDTPVPRRNGATLAVLSNADRVLAVGAADPVGLARLVRGLADLTDAIEGIRPHVIVNRLRAGPVPGNPERELRAALDRFAGVRTLSVLPEDRSAVDAGLASGRVLAEVAPASPLRGAVRSLATELSGRAAPRTRRRPRMRIMRRPAREPVAGPRHGIEPRS